MLINSISRGELYAKHLDQRRTLRTSKEISHWIAGHGHQTDKFLAILRNTRYGYRSPQVTNVYHICWHKVVKAIAKAAKAEVALRGHQRIQRHNFKQALQQYLDVFIEQAATVSVDWWEKLKCLRICTNMKESAPNRSHQL